MAIALTLGSFPILSPTVKAQNRQQVSFVPELPPKGAPRGRRRGAASRSDEENQCPDTLRQLTALVPETENKNGGLTNHN